MKYNGLVISFVVMAAMMVSSCLGQIHFTPTWGNGKRSVPDTIDIFGYRKRFMDDLTSSGTRPGDVSRRGQVGPADDNNRITDSIDSLASNDFVNELMTMLETNANDQQYLNKCTRQSEHRVVVDMAMILAREAKRLAACIKGCPSH